MTATRLVVIGASSGGIEAVQLLLAGLPGDLAAAVCVVIHIAPDSPGTLPLIVSRDARLPAVNAETGMRLEPGHVYVAPPDHHMVVEPGTLRLTKGPRENRVRPSVDPLFRSAAQVYGPAAIGVVLTGNLDDGTAGLWTIKRLGGIAIVQSPHDAQFPSMPRNAAKYVDVDYSLPLNEIAPLLAQLVAAPVQERADVRVPAPLEVEVKIAKEHNAIEAGIEEIAEPSIFACPECHGVLLRLKDEQPLRFRCHTGHAYSAESLLAAADEGIEAALWTAIRSLEEGGLLLRHLSVHLGAQNQDGLVEKLTRRADGVHQQAEVVRRVVSERHQLATSAS